MMQLKHIFRTHFNFVPLLTIFIIAFGGCGDGAGGEAPVFMEMVSIPGGTFIMGSPATEPNRSGSGNNAETQHSTTVSSFYMGKYPVTHEQFFTIMGFNTAGFTSGENMEKRPVNAVTWFDAVAFCNKLSGKEGLMPVYTLSKPTYSYNHITAMTVTANFSNDGYRLPTEAEWEYACRGSYANKAAEYATKPFAVGDGMKMTHESGLASFDYSRPYDLAHVPSGAYTDMSKTAYAIATVTGIYSPNNYGLYDMHGNINEWCWDWHGIYPGNGLTNYTGPDSGTYRILRGGYWKSWAQYLRSASRDFYSPDSITGGNGFRVVRR